MITAQREKSSLLLELNGGIYDGKQKMIYRRFKLVNTSATNEQIYEAGLILSSLLKDDTMRIKTEYTDRLSE